MTIDTEAPTTERASRAPSWVPVGAWGFGLVAVALAAAAIVAVQAGSLSRVLGALSVAAGLGALGGILITPITLTSFDIGIMLGLKGFVAAVLGGMGNGLGAVIGGLLVGIIEAMTAGYISSAYKDAVPFVMILFILFFMPRGLLGAKVTERV